MATFALLHSSDLLGEELKDEIGRRTALEGPLKLLSTVEAEIGTLTESRSAAAVVQRFAPDDLEGVDVAFFSGPMAANRPLLAELPEATTAIVLSPDATLADGKPVVAGVNLDQAHAGGVFLSPNAGVVLLAQLLEPLLRLGARQAVATLVQPASVYGKQALDELYEQTRSLLAFSSERPREVFGRQLAFNLYPPAAPPADLSAQVRDALRDRQAGGDLDLAVQLLQGGVFHGVSASLYVRFDGDPGEAAVRDALAASPRIDFGVDEEPSPVDAASRGEALVGSVRRQEGEPGAYWLWAVMDNLTVGGAINAAEIAEAVLRLRTM